MMIRGEFTHVMEHLEATVCLPVLKAVEENGGIHSAQSLSSYKDLGKFAQGAKYLDNFLGGMPLIYLI